MKVIVIHKGGLQETITLTEPLELLRGDKLNRLVTSTGAEHWFDQDGYYDGWGMQVNIAIPESEMPLDGSPPKAALEAIEQFDKDREFPEQGKEPRCP